MHLVMTNYKRFFLNNNEASIYIFSYWHFIFILVTFLIVLLIVKNRKKIYELKESTKKRIRLSLALLLIINFMLRRGSFILYNVYDWKTHLDIGFCNFTWIMFLIYSLTGSKKIYNACFYMAFIGPLLSIMIPSVNISPLNYSFYSFIIIHHIIFIYNFIFLFFEKPKYNKQDYFESIIFIICYFILLSIFNSVFNVDYNKPHMFINNNLWSNQLIVYLFSLKFIPYIIEYLIVFFQIIIAKKIVIYFSKHD